MGIVWEDVEAFIEKHLAYQEGLADGKKEVVLNMHSKNYKIEDIAEITKLSIAAVENIIAQTNENWL